VAGVADRVVGAKWGAIIGRYWATSDLSSCSTSSIYQASSYGERHGPTAWISFASRGSGVQIPSAPPSSSGQRTLLDLHVARRGSQVVKGSGLAVGTSPHQHVVRSSMVPTSKRRTPSLMATCLVGAAVMSYGMYTFLHPFCTIWPACTRGSSSTRLYSQCSDT
jgi:hypothetical protein